jgi:hypothetical protein
VGNVLLLYMRSYTTSLLTVSLVVLIAVVLSSLPPTHRRQITVHTNRHRRMSVKPTAAVIDDNQFIAQPAHPQAVPLFLPSDDEQDGRSDHGEDTDIDQASVASIDDEEFIVPDTPMSARAPTDSQLCPADSRKEHLTLINLELLGRLETLPLKDLRRAVRKGGEKVTRQLAEDRSFLALRAYILVLTRLIECPEDSVDRLATLNRHRLGF